MMIDGEDGRGSRTNPTPRRRPLVTFFDGNNAQQDEDAEADVRHMFYFDWDFRRLLPRQRPSVAPYAEDMPADGLGGLSSQGLQTGERFVRRDMWSKHGCPMHFLTLEFHDIATELAFQKDLMRRLKRWVGYASIIAAFFNVAFAFYRMARYWPVFENHKRYLLYENIFAGTLYALQYLQLKHYRAFVLCNFQEVSLLWSFVHASAVLTLVPLIGAFKCEEVVISHIVITFLVTRMRFYYFLLFVLYVFFGIYALSAEDVKMWNVLTIAFGFSFLSYSIEVLNRKDFVQVNTAWTEGRRSELLLRNILPAPCVKQLKDVNFLGAIAQSYEHATVLFADVVGFTNMSASISPPELVDLLNRMFSKIDQLADENSVEKVKTIGDCYMAVAGVPLLNPTHAQTMARFGLQLVTMVGRGELRNPVTDQPIQVRVGIHSGPCVAGVIGHKKFAYDIWGDAVNTAARMESHGEPMRLHCSDDTYALLHNDFICQAREPMTVKGKGVMQTYFVLAERGGAQRKTFKLEQDDENNENQQTAG
eukprot:TRINITY_DN1572_c1_g2_i1.p1 TRINITY_DN1572_c1_g2~~TRINITY_DN1572_c1_g2_i1.p1  ORF type:complete len:594 (+),score=68.89 TRINITY_DN1572_c1_g2_i1:181-1782(+)